MTDELELGLGDRDEDSAVISNTHEWALICLMRLKEIEGVL